MKEAMNKDENMKKYECGINKVDFIINPTFTFWIYFSFICLISIHVLINVFID